MNTITNHFVEGHANERFGEDRVELALVDGRLDRRLDDGQHCRSEAGRRLGLGHEAQRQRPQDGGRAGAASARPRRPPRPASPAPVPSAPASGS